MISISFDDLILNALMAAAAGMIIVSDWNNNNNGPGMTDDDESAQPIFPCCSASHGLGRRRD